MTLQLSNRYAKALLNLSIEKNCEIEVEKSIFSLKECFSQSTQLIDFVTDSFIKTDRKLIVLKEILLKNETLPDVLMKFLQFLATKDRLSLLVDIIDSFLNILKKKNNEIDIKLFVSFNLYEDKEWISNFKDVVSKMLGKKLHLVIEKDDNLLGGFAFSVEDFFYDFSIRGKMELLSKRLFTRCVN